MRPGGEGQMRYRRGPVDVELVRRGKDAGIAVGCSEEKHQQVTSLDAVSVERDVLRRHPGGELDRRVVAQHLFHHGCRHGRILFQAAQLFGVAHKCLHPVGDEVDRRLVRGVDQRDAGCQQLAFAQLAAVFFGADEVTGQVVLRRRALARDKGAEVGDHLGLRARRGRDGAGLGSCQPGRIQRHGERRRPPAQGWVVGGRYPKQHADHR
jgi:hypothetical protein